MTNSQKGVAPFKKDYLAGMKTGLTQLQPQMPIQIYKM